MSQNDTQKKLTARQKKAIGALLAEPTIEAAAEVAGVARKTIYRYLEESHFTTALRAAEGRILDTTTRRLLGLADKALKALESVLDNPTQDGASVKRLAAVSVLDHIVKLRELRDFDVRLAELERVVFHEN